ncbi:MAG TPA: ATP-binding protein [Pyrinomonadaceae bacterium]|nr:ATP-binding protein [Pyrinomonadaceae bacterium]
MSSVSLHRGWSGYFWAATSIAVLTSLLFLLRAYVNSTTVGFTYLLLIVFVAILWGSAPALLASVLGVLGFNFFFLPPFHTFRIGDPQNWFALAVFFVSSIAVGQLSAKAKKRAVEAEVARSEVERLYQELQDSFERSSQAQALKQSERLKSALLDAVTHDFRTPLTSIKASATAMLDDLVATERDNANSHLDNESRKEMLQVIDEEADRLDHFVEGLTKLARIDAGDIRLQLQPAALDDVVGSALKRAEPRTRTHRMEVWIDDLPLITIDELAISQAIYILIDNAAKYSPPDSRITVRANQAKNSIMISVEDSGPGIRVEARERIFEKFFRAMRDGDISDRQVSGSGLGLAIARGIVEAHHGRIWVEDAEHGSGAKFVIELPISVSAGAVSGR